MTVNLAPADLRKEGPAYDLPIAAALLALNGQIACDLDGTLLLGKLSLDGSVRHVNGVLRGDVPLVRHRPFRAPHHTSSAATRSACQSS